MPDGAAWAVVCDGMGGAAGGNIASSNAVAQITHSLHDSYRPGLRPSSVKNILESALSTANSYVYDMALKDPSLAGMGTTCVAAIIIGQTVYVAHVGDSRAYLISKSGSIRRLTKDHSMVQNLIEQGSITQEEAVNYPGKNIITRAIGVDAYVQIDFNIESFNEDDILLLCSDGLTNYLTDEEIAAILIDSNTFEYSSRLVNTANENGGGDNITAVTIAF
jgi:protein phosphatase